MNKLDLAKSVQNEDSRSLIHAESRGPAPGYGNAQVSEVIGGKERFGLSKRACYIYGKKIRAWMLFLELLERGQLRATRQSAGRPEGKQCGLAPGRLIIELLPGQIRKHKLRSWKAVRHGRVRGGGATGVFCDAR